MVHQSSVGGGRGGDWCGKGVFGGGWWAGGEVGPDCVGDDCAGRRGRRIGWEGEWFGGLLGEVEVPDDEVGEGGGGGKRSGEVGFVG